MTSRPRPFLLTLSLVAVVLAGLCFGNLLHQVLSHGGEEHDQDSPLTCWVCAATHHVVGDLGSESGWIAAPSTASTDVLLADPTFCSAAERGSAPPRSPPHSI